MAATKRVNCRAPRQAPDWITPPTPCSSGQDEGFGLSVIEALACDVPAFGTPVGIHPVALGGIDGAFCEPWDAARWRAALRPVLEAADPRVAGRARAELFSADRMADRVVEAWQAVGRSRSGAPTILDCSSASARALLTDYERTHATHHAPERRRRRPAYGRRAGA